MGLLTVPIIGGIVEGLAAMGRGWIETRKVKAQGAVDVANAKTLAKVKRAENIDAQDLSSINQMQFTWKDEYLLVLWSIPMVMCFVPPLTDYALRGFAVLAQTPEWYRYCFIGMVVATYGLKGWFGRKGGM